MAAPSHPYGDTCPVLRIAQHYSLPYEVPLALVDYYLHGRPVRASILEEVGPLAPVVADDCAAVAHRVLALRAGTEVFP